MRTLKDVSGPLGKTSAAHLAAIRQKPRPPFTQAEIIEAAFTYFRDAGFPYRKLPLHVCQQDVNTLSQQGLQALIRSTVAYHVGDTYHPHRFHGHADGKISPYAAFMDDRRLKRAIKLSVESGATIDTDYFGTLSLVLGTQACSNFRPGFAAYIYRKFCPHPDSIVLDTSTGYGGRLIGAIASGVVKHYVGIDPNRQTYLGNRKMATDLGWAKRVTLFQRPAEDVDPNGAVMSYVCGQGVDLAFTSPPYFGKEFYSDEPTQSRLRYPTPAEWYLGFLLPTMRLQYALLKPGATALVNIADINLKGKRHKLVSWCEFAAKKAGLMSVGRLEFAMSARYGSNQDAEVATEPVLIFEKPKE